MMKKTAFTEKFRRQLALIGALIITLQITAGLQSAQADKNSALKRTLQTYDKAKGYVADWTITLQLGQNQPIRHRVSIEWKDNHHLVFTMEPDGQPPASVSYLAVDVKSVLDGKHQWTLLPKRNVYTRDPLPKTSNQDPLACFLPPLPNIGQLAPVVNSPSSPPSETSTAQTFVATVNRIQTLITVDTATNRILKVVDTATTPLGLLTLEAEPNHETFNQKLADHDFKFIPPPGTKQVSSADLGWSGLFVGARVVHTH